MLLRYLFIVLMFIVFAGVGFSQTNDTTRSVMHKDSLVKKHSPRKAALMSTFLPGLGQAYNKKYWKIPVIYAGFTGLAYAFSYNQTRYVKYRDAYKYRIDNNPATVDDYVNLYTDNTLFSAQQYYHRYRDLSLIGAGLLYVLNIVDASVDAHLFTFDVSDDLTIRVQPDWSTVAMGNAYGAGLAVTFNF